MRAHNGEDRSTPRKACAAIFGALHPVDRVALESAMALWAARGATKMTS